jgi:oligoribonuclease (3'-5' exoribonuclease)
MSEPVFLGLDCESGGIGEDISLLSAHFAVCDAKWNIIDELLLLLKPKEVDETGSTIYRVTAAALGINHINLIEHDKVAVTKAQAGTQLRDFLWKYKRANGWLTPMGKNVGGDIKWVNNHILGAPEWSKYVSYRTYDITTVTAFLKRKGKLAEDAPESLELLAKWIGFDFVPHTADGDNRAGIAVMKYLEGL